MSRRILRLALALIAGLAPATANADVVAKAAFTRAAAAQATAVIAKSNAKLLRAASGVQVSNAATNPPWIAPSACPASTAVPVGLVCVNAGNWYMVGIAGTTGASSPPTTTLSGAYIADGTASWTYLGGARITSNDAFAPTITTVTTNPGGSAYRPVTYPGAYRILGATGSPYVSQTDIWQLSSYMELGSVPAERGATVAFKTDAAAPIIFVKSNSGCVRLIVDDRYMQPGCFNFAGADTWLKLDWSSVGGHRMRSYEVECGKSACLFGGVAVSTLDQVIPATYADDVRVVAIGDSISPGGGGSTYGPWLAGNSMVQLIGRGLGWRDAWNLSTGGSGLIANNTGTTYTFGQRIPQGCTLAPDVWLVGAGSSNDVGQTSAAEQAAMLAMLQAIRACSSAPIIAIGVPSINANTAAIETAAAAAITAFGDPRTFFVPVSTAARPWVMGSWNNTGFPASTSNAAYCIAGDATHPPEIGTQLCYAARAINDIRSLVLSKLAVQ